MDKNAVKKNKFALIFALISAACFVIDLISTYIFRISLNIFSDPFKLDFDCIFFPLRGETFGEKFDTFIHLFPASVLHFVPCALLILCILFFANKKFSNYIIPGIFIWRLIARFVGGYSYVSDARDPMIECLLILSFLVAIYYSFDGLPKKYIAYTAISVAIYAELYSYAAYLRYTIDYAHYGVNVTGIFYMLFAFVEMVAFYIAFMLWISKNDIRKIIPYARIRSFLSFPSKEEKALYSLNSKLYNQTITEDEFKDQKANILNNI